jgi:hypothetical protein
MSAKLKLLTEQPNAIENYNDDDDCDHALSENVCQECDCILEKFYDESCNMRYFCDNCGSLGGHMQSADMDITK